MTNQHSPWTGVCVGWQFFLMSYKSRAIYFQHQNIVDHTYRTTIHKLHLALMLEDVNREAYAVAFINMPCLGQKTDEERFALDVSCGLWMHITRHLLTRSWVGPLPLLAVCT